MSEWKPIEIAPKNPEGEGVGPWIMIFSDWDHGRYQARWEVNSSKSAGWRILGRKPGPWSAPENIRAWMELPVPFREFPKP